MIGLLASIALATTSATGFFDSTYGQLPDNSRFGWSYHDSAPSFTQPRFQDWSGSAEYLGDQMISEFDQYQNATSGTRYWERDSSVNGSFSFSNGFYLSATGIFYGENTTAPGMSIAVIDSAGYFVAIAWNVESNGHISVRLITNPSTYAGSQPVDLNSYPGSPVSRAIEYTLTIEGGYATLRIDGLKNIKAGGTEDLNVPLSTYTVSSGKNRVYFGDGSTGSTGHFNLWRLHYNGS